MTLRWTDEQLEAHRKRVETALRLQTHVKLAPEPLASVDTLAPAPRQREATLAPKAKTSKYGSVKTGKHASKKESRRAQELHLMEKAGTITNLREQVRYELIPAQYIEGKCVERAVTYVADFVYDDGAVRVEDCKGFRTPIYILKRKLMLFLRGIRVIET